MQHAEWLQHVQDILTWPNKQYFAQILISANKFASTYDHITLRRLDIRSHLHADCGGAGRQISPCQQPARAPYCAELSY